MQRSSDGALVLFLLLCACSGDGGPADMPATAGTGDSGASAAGQGAGAGSAGVSAGSAGTGITAGAGGGVAGSGGSSAGAGGMTAGAAPDADAAVDAGEMPMERDRPLSVSFDLPIVVEAGGVEPWFNVYRPMDLDATGQPLPVIVWANGGCLRVDFAWATLLNRWAAAGFVVLALTESPTDGAFGQTTAEQQGLLIDWSLAQAELSGGPYEGKLDTERVIAAGNSCGGVTALNLAAVDKRAVAVFVLSGSSAIGAADEEVMAAIDVPVGFIVGSPDEDIAYPNADMDYGLLSDGVPALFVSSKTGDHFAVSSDEAMLKQEAEISLHWLDLAVYGTPEAADALASANLCDACEPGLWMVKSKHLDKLKR